jgi:Calx-beta domain
LNHGAAFIGNPLTGDACVRIDDVSLIESNSENIKFVFRVTTPTLPPEGGENTGITYATVAGTATPNTDYIHKTGFIKFWPSNPIGIRIVVLGDTTIEPDETFSVNILSCGNSCTILDNKGVGTIQNDDG